MENISQNARGILDKMIITAKQNRNMYSGEIQSYYDGRLSALCEVRNWIDRKQNDEERKGN
jgi:hypothetical protein|tara:strand:- start:399 stop:581 length:183 start_codon:yes stop_codon:yes gene_type:complete